MAAETEETEGGSGKIFLILGLMIGIAAGAGGFYFMGGSPEKSGTEDSKKHKKAEILIPVLFERLAVPIYSVRGNSRRYIGNYFIDLKVLVRGSENQILVKRSMPQLQHAFIAAISKADLMREGSSTELDIDAVSKLLKAKAVEVVGADIVVSVVVSQSMRISN
jgi:flagellar basal body-associated protein FliL